MANPSEMGGAAVRRLMMAVIVVMSLFTSTGHADDFGIGAQPRPPYVARTFAIADDPKSPNVRLTDSTVFLIGEPDSKSFGVSYKGTLLPQTEMKGTEKLVAYFFVNCDKEGPGTTKGLLVGSVPIADIREGRETYGLIATVDGTAFVPLRNVECVKLEAMGVSARRADDFGIGSQPKPPYRARTFAIPDDTKSPDVRLTDTTVSLIGEPDSKSFGVSYRGTLDPQTEMKGTEKLVAYFYANCDKEDPTKTKGLLLGSVPIADIKEGRETYSLIATVDATTFAPLTNVDCVKLGVVVK